MNFRVSTLTLLALLPGVAFCDDPAPPPPQDVWTGKGQAGYTSSHGNTDASSANAALDAAFVDGPWKHALHLSGLYGESAGLVSAERWEVGWQTNYNITKKLFTFGALRDEHDMFSGFQYQATANAGIGYQVFDTAALKLSIQGGLGFRELRPENLIYNTNGDGGVVARTLEPSQGGAVETLGLNYSQSFTKTTTLTDKLLVETGSDDTLISNTLALAVKISTKLALSVGYNWQDNSKPPAPLKKLDTLETLNLVYSF